MERIATFGLDRYPVYAFARQRGYVRRETPGPEVLHLLDHERYVCLAREEIGRAARDS